VDEDDPGEAMPDREDLPDLLKGEGVPLRE